MTGSRAAKPTPTNAHPAKPGREQAPGPTQRSAPFFHEDCEWSWFRACHRAVFVLYSSGGPKE